MESVVEILQCQTRRDEHHFHYIPLSRSQLFGPMRYKADLGLKFLDTKPLPTNFCMLWSKQNTWWLASCLHHHGNLLLEGLMTVDLIFWRSGPVVFKGNLKISGYKFSLMTVQGKSTESTVPWSSSLNFIHLKKCDISSRLISYIQRIFRGGWNTEIKTSNWPKRRPLTVRIV